METDVKAAAGAMWDGDAHDAARRATAVVNFIVQEVVLLQR